MSDRVARISYLGGKGMCAACTSAGCKREFVVLHVIRDCDNPRQGTFVGNNKTIRFCPYCGERGVTVKEGINDSRK